MGLKAEVGGPLRSDDGWTDRTDGGLRTSASVEDINQTSVTCVTPQRAEHFLFASSADGIRSSEHGLRRRAGSDITTQRRVLNV